MATAKKAAKLSEDEAEKEFDRIADSASTDAAGVKCDVECYKSGLRAIIDRLNIDLVAAGE